MMVSSDIFGTHKQDARQVAGFPRPSLDPYVSGEHAELVLHAQQAAAAIMEGRISVETSLHPHVFHTYDRETRANQEDTISLHMATARPVSSTLSHVDRDKRFQCQVCEKGKFVVFDSWVAFKRMEHLQRHTMIHTGEKPSKCDICDKRFSRADQMKRHVKRVHKEEAANYPQLLTRPRATKSTTLKAKKKQPHMIHTHSLASQLQSPMTPSMLSNLSYPEVALANMLHAAQQASPLSGDGTADNGMYTESPGFLTSRFDSSMHGTDDMMALPSSESLHSPYGFQSEHDLPMYMVDDSAPPSSSTSTSSMHSPIL